MPQRIQLLLSAGHVVPENTHLLAHGQPYLAGWECGIREGRTAAENQQAYRAWLDENPDVAARIRQDLAGLDVACICPTGRNVPNVRCLGDVVVEVANTEGERS